jgi:enterochelin esterase-like enzyme
MNMEKAQEKHTPGPWRHNPDNTGMNDDGRIMAGITVIATDVYGRTDDEGIANARLIAAAPELLEAAKEAQCSCTLRERASGHLVECWMPALVAAIAKATEPEREWR